MQPIRPLILVAGLISSLPFALSARADETVRCTINYVSFWTTSGICYPLLAEAKILSELSSVTSRNDLLHLCEIDLRAKFPGANRPTYLNACEQLLAALRLP
ncbi:MAG: hypothetical protein ACOY5H_11005 [Pseudomonadota bacterium]